MKPKVIDWDNLPPLTPEEDAGILAALDTLDAGRGIPLADVVREIRGGSFEPLP